MDVCFLYWKGRDLVFVLLFLFLLVLVGVRDEEAGLLRVWRSMYLLCL